MDGYLDTWRIVVQIYDPSGQQRYHDIYGSISGGNVEEAIDYVLANCCQHYDSRAGYKIVSAWGVPELLCSPDVRMSPIYTAEFKRSEFQPYFRREDKT